MERRERILDVIARISGRERGALAPNLELVADLGFGIGIGNRVGLPGRRHVTRRVAVSNT